MSDLATSHLVGELGISHFNLVGGGGAEAMARWHNRLQELAGMTRLGIPVTISSDPRHHFTDNPLTAGMSGAFSEWPETTGLAATGDAALVERFADAVRREYLAVGIRVALHPQADLATEPRWGRISGTFGEDAQLASRFVPAYIRGLRGDSLGPSSVAAMVKHFPGAGPQLNGEDAHFSYGREQVYPGGNFGYHLGPFRAAIEAGAAQIMPYYGMPVGTPYEEVGFGFSKQIVTGLLRGEMGFDGIICTDWGLVTDDRIAGQTLPARAWGVEHLSLAGRVLKILDAGADQLGGEACPELVVELVRSGAIPESRIDESAARLLRLKFVLGLFDDPFVDEDAAGQVAGCARLRAEGLHAQSRAVTVLTNDGLLPLRPGIRICARGFDTSAVAEFGQLVDDPLDAEVVLVRLAAPYEPRSGPLEQHFHAGRLAFTPAELQPVLALAAIAPTVIAIYLERPAVIPELAHAAGALVADFGAADIALAVDDLRPGKAIYSDPGFELGKMPPGTLDIMREMFASATADGLRAACPRWSDADIQAELAGGQLFDFDFLTAVGTFDPGYLPEAPAVPSLIQLADPSLTIQPETADKLAERGFTVRVVPATGHCIHRDDLDGFFASMEGFV
jgi:beta-glucosidase